MTVRPDSPRARLLDHLRHSWAWLPFGVLAAAPPALLAQDLEFAKSFRDNPVSPGGTSTLEFTITNNSATETATNISFTDDLNETLPGLVATGVPTIGGPILEATFGNTGSPSIIGGAWDYLDTIENENGALHDYPQDANRHAWNSVEFDVETSTLGPWLSGDAPLQGDVIDGFPPGTPDVLFGIDAAPNGQNLVTTYLFRHDFTLTAAQLAEEDWLVEYLIDDGGIVYVNGVEVLRTPAMPAGPVTTTTLSGLGDENAFLASPVNLAGLLVEGKNTLAVEVHQNTLTSSDVGFFLELLPASESATGGFTYADDTFNNTNDPDFAAGFLDETGGASGAGLAVVVGGQTGFFNFDRRSSGGWSRTFSLDAPATVTISFRYRLVFQADHENDEFGQAIFELDGTRFGNGPGNSLAQFTGDGNGGNDADTGWQAASFDLALAAGAHTMVLGAYSNRSTAAEEITRVWFDDVNVGVPVTPAPVCGPGSQLTGTDLLTLTGGSLGPGQSCTFGVEVQAPPDAPDGDYLNTTSDLASSLGNRGPASDILSIRRTVSVTLGITESIDPVTAGSGAGNLTYQVTASNDGPFDATGLTINLIQALPDGVTPDSITPSAGTFAADVWNIGTLAAGASETLTFVLTAGSSALAGNDVIALTSVFGEVNEINLFEGPPSVVETTSIASEVDLQVTKSESADPVVAGSGSGNLTYVITVTNNGPSDASGVEIDEALTFGAGIGVESFTPSTGSFAGATWSVGDLAAGASETFTIVLTVGPAAPVGSGTITNTASVSAVDQPLINPEDDSATESTSVVREVDLAVTVSESRDPVLAGFGLPGNLRHTVSVTNNGPSDASNLSIDLAQALPEGVSLDTVIVTVGGGYAEPVWTVSDLASGDSTFVVLEMSVATEVPGGTDAVSTTGTLSAANETLLNPADDSAAESTSVVSPANVEQTAGDLELDLQTGLFRQTLTVTNNNPGVLPAFRVPVSGLPESVVVHNAQGEAAGASFLLYNQSLAPGASVDLVAEFFQEDASGGFQTVFDIELLEVSDLQPADEGMTLDRIEALPNGDILLEFPSTVGGLYLIQYSQDGENWFNVVPQIVAGGTRRQWIDNGPPKTPSHPSTMQGRLYRVVELETP